MHTISFVSRTYAVHGTLQSKNQSTNLLVSSYLQAYTEKTENAAFSRCSELERIATVCTE